MKKLVLDSEFLTDDFYEDAKLFGISASIKNYKLCWSLNNYFGYDFRCNPNIEIELQKKGRNYFFPVYQYNVLNSNATYYIYNNVNEGEFLIPELKMIDYILLVKGGGGFPPLPDQYDQLLKGFRSIAGVRLLSEISLDQIPIKNRSNLIF